MISLCMIVKNEEKFLEKCLSSVAPLCFEMIVVDTGSTDATKVIAEKCGAKVYDFPWIEDFSAARNYSLSLASEDFIFVLDADEVVAVKDHHRFSPFIDGTAEKKAHIMTTRNYTQEVTAENWTLNDGVYAEQASLGWFPSPKVRIFPNRADVIFKNPVHELVEPALVAAGIEMVAFDVPVHHYGRIDAVKFEEKKLAYYELGKLKIARDGSIRPIIELAIQAGEMKRPEEAIALWTKVIERDPKNDLAYYNRAGHYIFLRKYYQAKRDCRRSIKLNPNRLEAYTNLVICELIDGEPREGMRILKAILDQNPRAMIARALMTLACYIQGQEEAGREHIKFITGNNFDIGALTTDMIARLKANNRKSYAERLK